MATVFDVAAFILREHGPMTTFKLQKLVYYAQGWSLGLRGVAVFPEPIQAWRNGPASPALFDSHRRSHTVSSLPRGNADALDPETAAFLGHVLALHAARSPEQLVEDTHSEDPWLRARLGLSERAHGHREITQDALREFFGNPVVQGILQNGADEEESIAELAHLDRIEPAGHAAAR